MTKDGRVVGVVLALVNVLAGAVAHAQLPGQFGIRFGDGKTEVASSATSVGPAIAPLV